MRIVNWKMQETNKYLKGDKMKKTAKNAKKWLLIAIALMLISMIGTSAMQTCGGRITIKELSWESTAGHQLSAYLYKPKSATAKNPAPAIVTVEGWYNNKSMQDLYSIELARRGYVVLALDMQGHGDSEALTWEKLYSDASGENSAVELAASLPYVDSKKIGITGHSSGGDMMGAAIAMDNQRKVPLIAAALYQASIPFDDTGVDHRGDFGSRNVGIVADQYDEFFFYGGFGLTSIAGTPDVKDVPRNFLKNNEAKNFLNFNEGAAGFKGEPKSDTYYSKNINGTTANRVMYTPAITHPRVTFSSVCVSHAVDFFEKSLGAPRPIASNNQIWLWKTAFNTIGLIGFFMFLAAFTIVMLGSRYFECLKTAETAQPIARPAGKGKAWFWGTLIISALFSGYSFKVILDKILTKKTIIGFLPQTSTLSVGIWCVVCGIFAVILMWLFYNYYGKSNGISVQERGVMMGKEIFWKTIWLALLTICVAFGILFFADYFFKADFRFYVVALRTFKSDTALIALRFLPFFLVFYVINSISINCFNYNELGGKKWVNIVVLAIFNALGVIGYDIIQYGTFFANGKTAFRGTLGLGISGIWAYPTIFFLFATPFITRAIYKHTKNPYIGGIINAIVVTIMCCANTATVLGS